MKNNHLYKLVFNIRNLLFSLVFFFSFSGFSQVGIGTEEPALSSMLDVYSNSLGMLLPRMSTLQRQNIVSPANSLLVYDTDERSFFYYDSIPPNPKWIQIASGFKKRTNHVLVKSVNDLPAVSDGKITLDPDYLYEINGTIVLTAPIDLNNAVVAGRDGFEDILQSPSGSGSAVFQGNTGGTIKNLVLKGVRAFNITGPGMSSGASLIIQNTIIDGMTSSVGTISGFSLYFGNIMQFIGNANGITYSNIGNLLLSNQGWMGNNSGIFERFTGSFGLIGKISGFSTVSGAAVALDFNSNPTVTNGVIHGVVFSGSTTASSGYVRGYTTGSYPGYNFTNAWIVDSPGIPKESDAEATGDINFPSNLGDEAGYTTGFGGSTARNPRREKIWGTTTSNHLFRFSRNPGPAEDNKIIYRGSKKRFFKVNASSSFRLSNTTTKVMLYLAKNGETLPETTVYAQVGNASDIAALKIVGTVEMAPGDYLQVFAERLEGSGSMFTISLNLSAK